VIRLNADETKPGRKLDLPMTSYVFDLLVARRALRESEFVFPGVGKSGHLQDLGFNLRKVAKATGIKVSTHDLRRSYITVAENCDISPLALKALVNHSLASSM
jgi:integrase